MSIRNMLEFFSPRSGSRSKKQRPSRLRLESCDDRAVPASLSISDVSILEGNSGTRNAQVTVSLTGASNPTVSVGYVTASGSALSGSDYQAVSGTLNFPKGVTSKTILIPIVGNTVVESNETFFINLRTPKKATIADSQGVVTIVNDDTRINIDDVWLAEGNSGTTSFNFNVRLTDAIDQPVTVNYATADGTAAAGSDYTNTSGTLTIPAGETSGTVSIPVIGDVLSEPDETFYVNLSNPINGTIADGQSVGHIDDDEPRIRMLGMDIVEEGNSGTTELACTVILTSASEATVTVDYATSDDSATTDDNDYMPASGTLTFAPGETSQTITLQVQGDVALEYDEYFYVNLSNSTNAELIDHWALATIQSDDNAVVHIESWYDSEPDPYYGDWRPFYFTVWLSAPSTETVTVDFSTVDGTAIAGSDYWPDGGTLTFNPGETSQTITVWVLPDWDYDWDETFYVVLSNLSSNALFQPGWETGYGMIFDNQGEYWW
jgi:hypothetical protein